MSRLQAVVFDLDDTLYPERQYVLSGFRAVSSWADERLGIPAAEGMAELEQLFEQGVRGDTFDRWLAAHQVEDGGVVKSLVQVYREHEPELATFPEVRPLLTDLRLRYRLGLVSDGYVGVQQRKLDALDVAQYFDAVVFSDEFGRDSWKPSRRPFDVVLARLQIEASGAIYVADNPTKDFLGARVAGLKTIRVRRPSGECSDLMPPTERHAADLVIKSMRELEDALLELEDLS